MLRVKHLTFERQMFQVHSVYILLMEEILHQWIGSLSRYLQGFYIPGGAGFLPSTVCAFNDYRYVNITEMCDIFLLITKPGKLWNLWRIDKEKLSSHIVLFQASKSSQFSDGISWQLPTIEINPQTRVSKKVP